MRKVSLIGVLIILLISLTGCGYLTGRTEEMISEYNNRLDTTLSIYEKLKLKADENKQDLYNFVLGESDELNGFKQENIIDLNDVSISSDTHIITKDKYFTAIDSVLLREVIILAGDSLVYVEVIWGADGVVSITRRVV